jgi:hypothetical protein
MYRQFTILSLAIVCCLPEYYQDGYVSVPREPSTLRVTYSLIMTVVLESKPAARRINIDLAI